MAAGALLGDVVLVFPCGRSYVRSDIPQDGTVLRLFRWAAEELKINPSTVELRHHGTSLPYSEEEDECPLIATYTGRIFHVSSIDCFLLTAILPGKDESQGVHFYIPKRLTVLDMANILGELLGRDAASILILHNRYVPAGSHTGGMLLQKQQEWDQELHVRVVFVDNAQVM